MGADNRVLLYTSQKKNSKQCLALTTRVTNIQPTKIHHTSTTIPMVPSTTMMLRATLPTKAQGVIRQQSMTSNRELKQPLRILHKQLFVTQVMCMLTLQQTTHLRTETPALRFNPTTEHVW